MPPLPKITTKAAGAADLLSCSTKLRRSPRAAELPLHWLIVAFPPAEQCHHPTSRQRTTG